VVVLLVLLDVTVRATRRVTRLRLRDTPAGTGAKRQHQGDDNNMATAAPLPAARSTRQHPTVLLSEPTSGVPLDRWGTVVTASRGPGRREPTTPAVGIARGRLQPSSATRTTPGAHLPPPSASATPRSCTRAPETSATAGASCAAANASSRSSGPAKTSSPSEATAPAPSRASENTSFSASRGIRPSCRRCTRPRGASLRAQTG